MLKKKYYYPADKYFTVTVRPNNTSFGSTVPYSTTLYLKNTSLSLSATPASGYNFIKWNDNNTNASRTVTVIADALYEAIFALPDYTVTYNANGATSGTVPIDSDSPYSSGSLVEVLGNNGSLAKTGYTFLGWNTAADGSGTSYSAGDEFTISSNIILYAQWILNQYTVSVENYSYSGFGGTFYIDTPGTTSKVLNYGDTFTIYASPSSNDYKIMAIDNTVYSNTSTVNVTLICTCTGNHTYLIMFGKKIIILTSLIYPYGFTTKLEILGYRGATCGNSDFIAISSSINRGAIYDYGVSSPSPSFNDILYLLLSPYNNSHTLTFTADSSYNTFSIKDQNNVELSSASPYVFNGDITNYSKFVYSVDYSNNT